jgi:YebC/PmpR family DNA-binding regulatory protein
VEVQYEGFGPGGFSVIIEAITDNKQRTSPEIKSRMEKLGGNLGIPGSVAYQFEQKGLITVARGEMSMDDLFLIAASAEADDIEEVGEDVFIYTKRENLAKVKDGLTSNSLIVKNVEIIRVPLTPISLVDKSIAMKALQFVEKLEELDDVQKVYVNFDIPDEIGKTLI